MAHAHRSRIEEENPSVRIPRRGHGSAFRHMGVTEQNPVRPVLFRQQKHLPVSGFGPGRVTVENKETESAQSDHVLLRRIDAVGHEPQSGVAVAPYHVGGNVGIFLPYGGRVKDAVTEKNHRICLAVVLP